MYVPKNIIKKNKGEDNYDTFETITDINIADCVIDRLYYVKDENKYYRFNDTLNILVEAINAPTVDLTEINNSIIDINTNKQNKLTASENILINASTNVISLANTVNWYNINGSTIQLNGSSGHIKGNQITNFSEPLQITDDYHVVNLKKLNTVIANLPPPSLEGEEISILYVSDMHAMNLFDVYSQDFVDDALGPNGTMTIGINAENVAIDMKSYNEDTLEQENSIMIDAKAGSITVSQPPTLDNHLTTKAYVDNAISNIQGLVLGEKVRVTVKMCITDSLAITQILSEPAQLLYNEGMDDYFRSFMRNIGPDLWWVENISDIMSIDNSFTVSATDRYIGFFIRRIDNNKIFTSLGVNDTTNVGSAVVSNVFKNYNNKADSWVFNNTFFAINPLYDNGITSGFNSTQNNNYIWITGGGFILKGHFT